MRGLLILLVVLICCWPAVTAVAQDMAWGTLPVATAKAETPVAPVADKTETAPLKLSVEEARARKGLSRKEKRTVRRSGGGKLYAWRILREMKKDGDLVDEEGKRLSNRKIAELIAEQWSDDNPEAFFVCGAQYAERMESLGMAREWESFFEALIKFFEDFLPILIKLIGLFGGL